MAKEEKPVMANYDLEVQWKGPYRWVNNGGQAVFDYPEAGSKGLYIWTIKYGDGYLIYYIGETGKSFRERLGEERDTFYKGAWRIFDAQRFAGGEKLCIWS